MATTATDIYTTDAHTAISDQIIDAAHTWAHTQHRLISLAASLSDSVEWISAGSATPAHHLAALADIEPSTAREWIRVRTRVRALPTIANAFNDGGLSYSKVRALLTIPTPDNETSTGELTPTA
ncbi:MAG: hypothetical protein ACI91O_000759 [Candidatus Poriferisodalaceae bacterium]|jgi:hypothetical protein